MAGEWLLLWTKTKFVSFSFPWSLLFLLLAGSGWFSCSGAISPPAEAPHAETISDSSTLPGDAAPEKSPPEIPAPSEGKEYLNEATTEPKPPPERQKESLSERHRELPPEKAGEAPPRGTWSRVKKFGSNPGSLTMFQYTPQKMPAQAPLVLVLHGCYQTAQGYAKDTGWNELADRYKFYVVYGEQSYFNNVGLCFNWFDASEARRDKGEALSLKQMIDYAQSHHSIDKKRIFVTGVSAGGVMSVALLASYPDLFAAGAAMPGIPFGCANSVLLSNSCMLGLITHSAKKWGELVRQAYPDYQGAYPRVSIFHGTSDGYVNDSNMSELVKQWTEVHGTDQQPEKDESFRGHRHRTYQNKQGEVVVETYHIKGMGHGIAVDPGTGKDQGGRTNTFAHNVGLWSSYYVARFWKIIP